MITPLRHTTLLEGTLQNLYYPPPNYTYFERAKDVRFQTSGFIPKAAWAADASMLAYARRGATRMSDQELEDNFVRVGLKCERIGGTPQDWNAPGTQAIFAECADFAICAFRGTEEDDPEDLKADANILLVPERDYRPVAQDPSPALGHLGLVSQLFHGPCLVHLGFQSALNQVWNDVHQHVTDYRSRHPHNEICFAGHSLGGALAVLAFSRFAGQDISLFTFGCPRVGDGSFRTRVLSNPGRGIYRFVNFNDAVTHIPLESLLYRQIPDSSYRFTEDGNLDTDDGSFKGDVESLRAAIAKLPALLATEDFDHIDAPPSLVDHSPARYCFRLWDLV